MEQNNSLSVSSFYLSDALNYTSFAKGQLNLIVAPCGSGKTTAAFTTIPNYLQIKPYRCLVLVSTVAAVDEFVNDKYAYKFKANNNEYDDLVTPRTTKPIIMTYALFGAQYKKKGLRIEDYNYIVCDELHSLNQSIAMSRAKLIASYPLADTWEINDMLQKTCFTYIAINTIIKAIQQKDTWVFALTATPSQLYRNYLQPLSKMINEVQFSQENLHAYKIGSIIEYSDIRTILEASINQKTKRLFYFHTIKELLQYKQVLLEHGRKAEAIWSTNATIPMDEHMQATREYILYEHRFPDDVEDLLINSAYELAITIKDPLVKEVYIHSSNADTREQARNRLRQDLDIVGYYSNIKYHNDYNAKRRKRNVLQCVKNIPDSYLNRLLTVQDKQELLKLTNSPFGWTNFKKALIEEGYEVIEKRNAYQRFSIISNSN